MNEKSKLSPMMQQYMAMKEQYKDTLLFFRLGDFYEMFFDDAILVSRELELTLTGRDCGMQERASGKGLQGGNLRAADRSRIIQGAGGSRRGADHYARHGDRVLHTG